MNPSDEAPRRAALDAYHRKRRRQNVLIFSLGGLGLTLIPTGFILLWGAQFLPGDEKLRMGAASLTCISGALILVAVAMRLGERMDRTQRPPPLLD